MNHDRDKVHIGDTSHLNEVINRNDYSSVFVLCDSNTVRTCRPYFIEQTKVSHTLIEMPAGEPYKTLATCQHVWKFLLENGADRHSLLINLGGGVVGDLGAFCASTYMRGISHIQIPTSLLAQVDASVGGKSGVDFLKFKNIIGSFVQPDAVIIDTGYLKTLDPRQLRNGFVEMLKHALIADDESWLTLKDLDIVNTDKIEQLVSDSVAIKQNIVSRDPLESGLRKALNFGHTIGHAFEYTALSQNQDLLHGEAIAFGIMVAARISHEINGLPIDQVTEIDSVLATFCKHLPQPDQVDAILKTAYTDKKNIKQELRFTLLDSIGTCKVDQPVNPAIVKNAILQTIAAAETMT